MKTAALFFLLFLFHHIAYAQSKYERRQHAVFDSFHRSVAALTNRFADKPVSGGIQADIHQSLASIAEDMRFLEVAIRRSRKQIPYEYLESLDLDARLLKRLARLEYKSEADRRSLYDGLKEVESDLALKVSGPARTGGSEVASLVQVLVHAKRGDQEIGAYEVWYVPKGWVNERSVFKRFDRLTDPSNPPSMNLAPGNYFIWLSKGQPVTDRQPVSISLRDGAKREIDVAVP